MGDSPHCAPFGRSAHAGCLRLRAAAAAATPRRPYPPTLRVHDCARGCTGVMASVPLRPYHQRIPTSVDPPWAQMLDTAACPRAEPPFRLGTQVLLGGAWAYLRSRRRRPHAPGRGEHTAGELVTGPAVAFGWSRLARASLLLCSGVYLCLGPGGVIRGYHPPVLFGATTRLRYMWIPPDDAICGYPSGCSGFTHAPSVTELAAGRQHWRRQREGGGETSMGSVERLRSV